MTPGAGMSELRAALDARHAAVRERPSQAAYEALIDDLRAALASPDTAAPPLYDPATFDVDGAPFPRPVSEGLRGLRPYVAALRHTAEAEGSDAAVLWLDDVLGEIDSRLASPDTAPSEEGLDENDMRGCRRYVAGGRIMCKSHSNLNDCRAALARPAPLDDPELDAAQP